MQEKGARERQAKGRRKAGERCTRRKAATHQHTLGTMAERTKNTDAAATTLLGEVTPVLSRLAERVEALQQPQSELLQTLRDSPLMDEAALANVEATIGQIPAYHEKLVTLQADMLQLATRTASMRQRSAHLASQAPHTPVSLPTRCTYTLYCRCVAPASRSRASRLGLGLRHNHPIPPPPGLRCAGGRRVTPEL